MKRIIGVSLAILLAFAALGGASVADANDSDKYDALIRYFHGEIDRDQLEAALADPAPGGSPPALFSQTLGELGDDYAHATTCGGTPNPLHEAFYRDPLGTNWPAWETVYCDLETGEWVTGRIPQPGVDFAWDHQLISPGDPGYSDTCFYTNSAGERITAYRAVKNADGTLQTDSEGNVIYYPHHGARWDPIAQMCTQR